MTTYAIGVASVFVLVIVVWPLRAWLSAKMATRTEQALGTALIFAFALQAILTLFVVPLYTPLPNAFSHETAALQVRATALQERYVRYRADLSSLGSKPAANSPALADWTIRQKAIEAERIAAGAAVDTLVEDVERHKKVGSSGGQTTDVHIGWALLVSLICFIAVFTGSVVRTRRTTRS